MLRQLYITLFLLSIIFLTAQKDSIQYTENVLTEGIYTSYEDFRKNNPITKNEIETVINKDQLDFFGKVIDQLKFSYEKNGVKQTVESKNMWGFYQNKTLYVNYKEMFYRVPVFGSICYLVAVVEVPTYYPGYYGPGGMSGSGVKTKEIREFVINFYDGKVEELNFEKVELLLSRDEELYKEFKALKRKKKKELISRFIKKYNEKHPIHFLK
ncbi:MAG: hypothetical protein K0S32_2834 [Bacteroidetes bacterium]|jgi:hypothetical protein|nr:hypothetical protein [Bacteroidota bacterium]